MLHLQSMWLQWTNTIWSVGILENYNFPWLFTTWILTNIIPRVCLCCCCFCFNSFSEMLDVFWIQILCVRLTLLLTFFLSVILSCADLPLKTVWPISTTWVQAPAAALILPHPRLTHKQINLNFLSPLPLSRTGCWFICTFYNDCRLFCSRVVFQDFMLEKLWLLFFKYIMFI